MPEDLSGWLTKPQAAAALGVSTKTVEALAKAGALQQSIYKRPGGGARVVVYHPQDVERERQARQPGAAPFVVPAEAPARANGNGRPSDTALAVQVPPVDELLRALVAAVVRAASEKSEAVSQKLFLTLDEAAGVTGLPRRYLERLVRGGRLEATRTRPRLVRRRDLEKL